VTQPTVLVVDDDDDIRELTQLALESVCGWNIVTAEGGFSAIEMCRTHRPDAVLLDMMMPDMDGLTTFEHLQADPTTRDIPVILFTAKGRVGERQPWENHEIRGMIAKPYDPMTLGEQVSEILDWDDARWSDAS
jgi:CheY-like chemotaxis protein